MSAHKQNFKDTVGQDQSGPDDDLPPTPAAPAARLPFPAAELSTVDSDSDRLSLFGRARLKELNEEIQNDPTKLRVLETEVIQIVDWPHLNSVLSAPHIPCYAARQLIKNVGFILGSLNRHYLVEAAQCGGVPGASRLAEFFNIAVKIDLADFLSKLACHASHPPYQSYFTYWMDNPEGHSFTNNPGEQYFRFAVNETNHRFASATEYLKSLQSGEISFSDPRASEILIAARNQIEPLENAYNFRIKNSESEEQRLTPEFFMKTMRGYIAPALLDATEIEGPNATYSPGWPRLDYAIGNRPLFYVNIVQSRYRWMIPEHRLVLDQALELPSVSDQLILQAGLSCEKIDAASSLQLRQFLESGAHSLRSGVHAYANLVATFNKISGTHFSMIQNYLTKPAAKLPEGELAKIVPRPDTGVGGNPIKQTKSILDMRRSHHFNAKLIEAVRGWN